MTTSAKPRNRPPVISTYIYNALRQSILGEEYSVGEKLPSENALSARFKANRITVRAALKRLAKEALVQSRPGVGWHVVSTRPETGLTAKGPVLLVGDNSHESVECLEAARQVLITSELETRFCVCDGDSGLLLGDAPWKELGGAVFFSGVPIPESMVKNARIAGVPLICAMLCSQESYDTVATDIRAGMDEAVSRLLRSGNRSIAYVSATTLEESRDPSFRIRRKGYEDAMREADLESQSFFMRWNGGLEDKSVSRFYAWLEEEVLTRPGPRCLFCASGVLIQAIRHLLEQHDHVTNDEIWVAGTSEAPAEKLIVNGMSSPALLLRFPYQDIGTVSAKRLLDRMRGDTTPVSSTLLPMVVIEPEMSL